VIHLPNDALVLEIGSGGSPQVRADVLVDRFYIDDLGHRSGQEIYKDKRPLIVADGERLPFADKAFDYVYCVHVIEHTDKPGAFLDEMSRVSKAGYLECPNPALERVLDVPQHQWYITNTQGKLLIHPKTKDSSITGSFDRLYFHAMSDHFIIRHYWDLFTVMLEWNDKIKYEICPDIESVLVEPISERLLQERIEKQKIGVLVRALKDAVKANVVSNLMENKTLLEWYRSFRRKRRATLNARVTLADLEPLLCCPYDREKLTKTETSYDCHCCGRKYLIKDGVPVFL
jgi:SAM-dependent methyltransferase